MCTIKVKVFYLQKDGYRPEQNDDAFSHDVPNGRLAIADGATTAYESGLWARIIVDTFVTNPPKPDQDSLIPWLEPLVDQWKKKVFGEELPWYKLAKAQQGSSAALLGMQFTLPPENSVESPDFSIPWQALAIGDACLFQIRVNKLIKAFPVEESTNFGITPSLLSTRLEGKYLSHTLNKLEIQQGECEIGDLFILATDAFAQWFLHSTEAGEKPWFKVKDLTESEFVALMNSLHQEKKIRNDDVTVLVVHIN